MSIKKLLVCGASLLMMASLSTGISNVSAKRVHHHARTYRVAKNNHKSLYKLGYNDAKEYVKDYILAKGAYPNTGTPREIKQADNITNQYMYHAIKSNFSKSYAKGFRKGYNDAGTTQMQSFVGYKYIRRFAHKHHLNSKNAYNYFFGKHSHKHATKHTRKNSKRHSIKKHNKTRRNTKRSKRMTTRKNKRHAKRVRKQNKKAVKKSVVKRATKKSNTNNRQSTSTDQTDGGKYYSWSQLKNVLNTKDVANEAESPQMKQKIVDTINYNLDKYKASQTKDLIDNYGETLDNTMSSKDFNKLENANNYNNAFWFMPGE